MQNTTLPSIDEFKKQAKKLKKETHIETLGEALNVLAKKYGYKNWFTIKPRLPEDKEPLVLTTIYTTIYNRDTEMSDAPYVEVCASREEQEDKILWMLKEEYQKEFESFEEAWIYHIKREFEDGEKWIRTENKEMAVRPHGKPAPIFSLYGEEWEISGEKYQIVTIEDALQSEYYSEHYKTIEEAEERDREIEELATTEWGLIKKEGIPSNYTYAYNTSSTKYIRAFVRAKGIDAEDYKRNGSYYIFLPRSTKDTTNCALYALGKEFGKGALDNYQIELFDIHENKTIHEGAKIPTEPAESCRAEVLKSLEYFY